MRILLTGGAGFIGSALARSLLADGHDVVIVDDLSTGKRSNVPAAAEFLEADLSQPETLRLLPNGPYGAVFHLAAQSSGAIGQKDPYRDMQTNTGATMLLSRWCLDHGVPKFMYASSMTVYGQGNREPVAETARCHPIGYYGASKLASEHYLRIASAEGLATSCLRLYNVYGPGQNLGNLYQGMASIYMAYMLEGVPVPVTGSFDRYRDFVYVDDVVTAFRRCLANPSSGHRVYNIGTGRKTTVGELLEALKVALGLPPGYPANELPGSSSDVFGSVADATLAARELDWQPAVALRDGLSRMAAWAKTQVAA